MTEMLHITTEGVGCVARWPVAEETSANVLVNLYNVGALVAILATYGVHWHVPCSGAYERGWQCSMQWRVIVASVSSFVGHLPAFKCSAQR